LAGLSPLADMAASTVPQEPRQKTNVSIHHCLVNT
jgi:hypothetical protein